MSYVYLWADFSGEGVTAENCGEGMEAKNVVDVVVVTGAVARPD